MPRPRKFDEGEVLDRAMNVFWRSGYEGASIAELSKAMGLNSPSIYAAFGSKLGLFEAVLNRYRDRRAGHLAHALAGTTARDVVERLLYGAVEWLTAPHEPLGCLLVQSSLSVESLDVPRIVDRQRQSIGASLRRRLDDLKIEGDLPEAADAGRLSRYVQTILSGVSLQAALGVAADELNETIDLSLQAWPFLKTSQC